MGLIVVLLVAAVVAVFMFGLWVVVTVISAVFSALWAVGGSLLPVLMIVFGAWLLWRALFGTGRQRSAREFQDQRRGRGHGYQHVPQAGAHPQMHAWQPDGPPTPVPPGAPGARPGQRGRRGGPEPVIAASPPPIPKRELPIDVQVKAEQIQRKADLLLAYADRFPPFSQSLHIVRQTAADYLPRTLEAYLALPGLSDPLVPTTGRTALTELRAQLQLLDSKLDDITLDLQQQDLDKMSANRRFLEDRFGVGADAPESPGAEPAPSEVIRPFPSQTASRPTKGRAEAC